MVETHDEDSLSLNSHLPCLEWFTQEGQGNEWGRV